MAVTTGAVGAPQDAGTYTTAYVVEHVESALDTAATADDIARLHIPDGFPNEWFYAPLDMPAETGALVRWQKVSRPGGHQVCCYALHGGSWTHWQI